MYELKIETHFDAAHSLTGYPGECARLHGHSFKVDVVIEGERLDKVGLVYDFKELKAKARTLVDRFDHHHLNEVPPFDKITPTAENLAKYLYHELQKALSKANLESGIDVKKVSIWESSTACISYFKE